MATFSNITHEYYHHGRVPDDVWTTLWEENQWRMWNNKSWLGFQEPAIVKHIQDNSAANSTTESHEALLFLKDYVNSIIVGPGFFHVVKSNGNTISIRAFARCGMEEIDTITAIKTDYNKDTCVAMMNMNLTDPDGSTAWVDLLYNVDGFADQLAKVPTKDTISDMNGVCDDGGCKRWFGSPTGSVQKAYIIRGDTAGWVMEGGHTAEKIADNNTPLYYFGPFGWPDDAGTIGEPE